MQIPASSSSADGSPDTTVAAGPLTAASETRSPKASSLLRTCPAGSAIESIPPLPASTVSDLDRNATTRAESSSERIPATHAAAISPCE